jgi:hypothetical protein
MMSTTASQNPAVKSEAVLHCEHPRKSHLPARRVKTGIALAKPGRWGFSFSVATESKYGENEAIATDERQQRYESVTRWRSNGQHCLLRRGVVE